MTLSHSALVNRLTHPNPEDRLVVTPVLDPKVQLARHQAAIDIRLGRVFSVVRAWTQGVAELLTPKTAAVPPPLDTLVVDLGQELIIHPHQFVLARTLEILRLPRNLLAYVVGRSSWGRRGLIVATAVVIHPGFAGPVTLELKNVGEVPIAVYPMDRIAQLVFHEVAPAEPISEFPSQFSSTYVPSLGSVRDPATTKQIQAAVQRSGRGA